MLTLSVVRTGAEHLDPAALGTAKAALHRAVASGLIVDGQVDACGGDISLIMSHRCGVDAPRIRGLAEGPTACAELEFTERPHEQVMCLFADATPPGVWNLPLYRIFADPLTMASAADGAPIRDEFSFDAAWLQHDPDPLPVAPPALLRVYTEHLDLAGGTGAVAFQDFDRGGFARAVRAEQREDLPFAHLEAEAVDGSNRPVVLAQATNADGWRHKVTVPSEQPTPPEPEVLTFGPAPGPAHGVGSTLE